MVTVAKSSLKTGIETQVKKYNNFPTSASFLSRDEKLHSSAFDLCLTYPLCILWYIKHHRLTELGNMSMLCAVAVSWHDKSFEVLGVCTFAAGGNCFRDYCAALYTWESGECQTGRLSYCDPNWFSSSLLSVDSQDLYQEVSKSAASTSSVSFWHIKGEKVYVPRAGHTGQHCKSGAAIKAFPAFWDPLKKPGVAP